MYFRSILWGISKNEGLRRLKNSVLENKGVYKWILVQIKRLLKQLKKARLEVLILERFILVLMESGTENHGNNSIS